MHDHDYGFRSIHFPYTDPQWMDFTLWGESSKIVIRSISFRVGIIGGSMLFPLMSEAIDQEYSPSVGDPIFSLSIFLLFLSFVILGWAGLLFFLNRRNQKGIENISRSPELVADLEWRNIFQAIGHPTIIVDKDQIVIAANRATIQATGLTEDELRGKKCYEIFHGKECHHPPKECPFGKVLSSHHVETFEMEIEALNGIYLISCTPILDRNGQIEKAIHIATDVTERKNFENRLRSLSTRLEAILAEIPDIVAEVNGNHEYMWMNFAGFEFFGEEAIGKKASSFYDATPPATDPFQTLWEASDSGFYVENWQRRKDGQTRLLAWSCRKVKDQQGNVKGALTTARDITDIRCAERALQESESRYRRLTENARDIIFRMSLADGKYEYVSPAVERIMGYLPSEFYDSPFLIKKIIHPDWIPYFEELWTKLTQEDISEFFEYPIVTKSGIEKWLLQSNVLIRDEQGIPVAMEGIITDITSRKHAENALQKSEATLKSLLQAAPIGIGLFRNRVIEWCNDSLVEITGYSLGELYGKNALFLYENEEEYIRVGKINGEEIFDVKSASIETRWKRKDDQIRNIFLSSTVIDPQNPSAGLIVTIMDMTDQKRSENRLRESEAKFRKILATLDETVFITHKSRIIQFCSGSVQKNLGYYPTELIGKSPRILYENDEQFDYAGQIHHRISNGEESVLIEVNMRKKSGDIVPMEMLGSRYDDENIVVVIRDISSRVNARIERDKLEYQLQQSQKMEAVGHLAGGIAHDFNNLLMAILGYCDLMKTHLSSNPELLNDLNEIKKAGERAVTLTRQLLAFSRKQVLQPEIVNLNDLIMTMYPWLRRMISENIELITLPYPGLGRVKVDPGQIEQIIMNLVVNARDAMTQGGTLSIETSNVELDETYTHNHLDSESGSYVMLAISDTGCGMSKETIQRIFDPFFSTKEKGKGSGMGLPTVYGIVKQSGGFIYVYSEPGKGTTFKIYFKRVDSAPHDQKIHVSTAKADHGRQTILLVEDEKMVRDLIARTLEMNRYKVMQCNNGVEAVSLAEHYSDPIHLLLTDVVMPKMGGREAASKILAIHPESNVLFMSGYTDNAIVHHGMLDEGVHFLQKPFQTDILLQKVCEILDS